MAMHAKATIETINKLGFDVLEHPAYSSDLAPSDYYLFAPLKDAFWGRKFSSDQAVQKRCINGCVTNQRLSSRWHS